MITKTDFLTFIDSPRHLWAIKHNKLDQKEINAYVQHLFEQGYEVEKYAERYIKEFLIPQYKALPNEILLQPTHVDGDFEARTDILIKNHDSESWDMYEIKSATKIDKIHKYDATFQTLVFQKKVKLGKIFLLHLNPDYVRGEEINLPELFITDDITQIVEELKDEVHLLRYEALDIVQEDNPNNVLACIRPKTCPCLEICHTIIPNYSIYDINNLTANEKKVRQLEEMGIRSVYDIPNDFQLSDKQKFQVNVAKSGIASIDRTEIQESINNLVYPLYFVDYESFNPAIPMYKGYKPYDQMPFQWSLHVQENIDSEFIHYEFIEIEEIDPIPNFLSTLQKVIGTTGSIIVWNETFEGTQNKRMGTIHNQYKDFCENMNSRMFDLMKIFRDGQYADPKFKGSYSIKKVLPVLVPELSYNGMNISEGATAMASWDEMVHKLDLHSIEQRNKIKEDLLRYCELDTMAMVRIYEVLQNLSKTNA